MEDAKRAVRSALSGISAGKCVASSKRSTKGEDALKTGGSKKAGEVLLLSVARVEETLGSCLDKMKERDVLSLPILDAKKGFVGFVSVERCLGVFLENAAIFLLGRREEPFCSCSESTFSANPRVMPPMIEELGLQPGDVSRFGCQYDGDAPKKRRKCR